MTLPGRGTQARRGRAPARDEALAAFAAAGTLDELKQAKVAHTGDRSALSLANREIGALLLAGQGRGGQADRAGPRRGQPGAGEASG